MSDMFQRFLQRVPVAYQYDQQAARSSIEYCNTVLLFTLRCVLYRTDPDAVFVFLQCTVILVRK